MMTDKRENSDPERQVYPLVMVSWLNTWFAREIDDMRILELIWKALLEGDGSLIIYISGAVS
jgi:hypothetical protein